MPTRAAGAFESLLDGLGVDRRAFTEGYGSERAQVLLNTSESERAALDDAASVVLGLPGAASSSRLARAIVRSWLVTPWSHPRELVEHQFDDGCMWSDSLDLIRSTAEWPEGLREPGPVFTAMLGRIDQTSMFEVALWLAAQLSVTDRAALLRALELLPK